MSERLTARCPYVADALPMPEGPVGAEVVDNGRCPLAYRVLTRLTVVTGVTLDFEPLHREVGVCPVPCQTQWWVDDGKVCYSGRELRVDWPEYTPEDDDDVTVIVDFDDDDN